MIKLYISLLLLLTPAIISAHNAAIRGTVLDSASKQTLPGVIVSAGPGRTASTDQFGNFLISNIAPGSYALKVTLLGYNTRTIDVEVPVNETKVVVIKMGESPLNLSEVEITQNTGLNSSMNIINQVDLSLRPVRSSQDVLKTVPGLVIAQHAGGGKAEQIFLRGFDIDHGTDISLTVDGMPVNMVSHAHGQGYADLHFLIPEVIDRVDFNKGPYYAEHGDFTTAGYAAFQTKSTLDRSSIKLEAGQFDSYRTVALIDLFNNNTLNRNAYIAVDYSSTDGYFESPQGFNRINVMGKYHERINDNSILTVSTSTFRSRWDASGQVPQRAIDQGLITRFGAIDDKEGGSTSRSNLNLQMTTYNENNSVWKNQVYFVDYDFELYSNFTFFLEDSINGDQIKQKEHRKIYGYNSSYSFTRKTGSKDLRSTFGMSIRYDDVNDVELSHTRQRKVTLNSLALGQVDQLNAALYADETLRLTDRLTVNAGLRFDHFQFNYVDDLDTLYERQSDGINILSPKLSLYYDLNSSTQLYVKSGTGFHSNDTRVVVAKEAAHVLPRAYGADAGAFFKVFGNTLVQAGVWMLDLEQEFVYVGDAAVVEPGDRTRRYGADLSLRSQPVSWLFIDGDINYTVPRIVGAAKGEDHVPLAPTLTTTGGATIKTRKGLTSSLRCRLVGDRPANEANTVTAKGYFLVDAVISYTRRSFEVSVTAENLLDAEWNEAQFDTESRLMHETEPVSELHFTPGTPRYVKASITFFFK
jgi:outer membrane cobalamin receptor